MKFFAHNKSEDQKVTPLDTLISQKNQKNKSSRLKKSPTSDDDGMSTRPFSYVVRIEFNLSAQNQKTMLRF